MFSDRTQAVIGVAALGTFLAACGGGVTLPPPNVVAEGTPTLTASVTPTTASTTGDGTLVDPLGDQAATGMTSSSLVPETLVGVYSRLARGLNGCWLRDGRPLGLAYVMHAKVDPSPATTGTMTVHLRSPTGRHGLKAFLVELSAASGQTRITTTNIKLLPKQSKAVTRDIVRWATGGTGCAAYVAHVPAPQRKPGRARPKRSAF